MTVTIANRRWQNRLDLHKDKEATTQKHNAGDCNQPEMSTSTIMFNVSHIDDGVYGRRLQEDFGKGNPSCKVKDLLQGLGGLQDNAAKWCPGKADSSDSAFRPQTACFRFSRSTQTSQSPGTWFIRAAEGVQRTALRHKTHAEIDGICRVQVFVRVHVLC